MSKQPPPAPIASAVGPCPTQIKLKSIWKFNNLSLGSKMKLVRSFVISIFWYACESWTLTAELEKRMRAFEMMLPEAIEYFA